MALKDRIAALKRQAGQATPEPATRKVGERIARLRPTRSGAVHGQRDSIEGVAAAVGGEVIADGLIRIERRLPLADRHGTVPLQRLLDDHRALPEAAGIDVRKAAFFDTETTGLSGGTGTTVFLLGIGRIGEESFTVRQYLITAFAAERAMLEDAGRWIEPVETLVSFNGKSFDLPLVAARARLLGMPDRFSRLGHLDLLHPTRRAFGRCWADCRLATAERQLLGFEREDDLPGAEAPAAWFDYLHRNDAGRLPGVARHNHWDIVSLAALLPALAAVHDEPRRSGADVLAVARAALKAGDEARSFRLLQQAKAELDRSGLLELARLYRNRGAWASALPIWEALGEAGCAQATEQLAKYYEHVAGDAATALTYAQRLPDSPEKVHRCHRLRRRLGEHGSLFEVAGIQSVK